MTFHIRVAGAEEASWILAFLRGMHAEIGQAPLNEAKAMDAIADVAATGVAYVVENEDLELVGSMGLTTFEHWYADAAFLGEIWLYVAPEYRAAGEVIALLMTEARDLAERTGQPVYLDHYRPRRGNGLTVVADRVGFTPVSRILELAPGGH